MKPDSHSLLLTIVLEMCLLQKVATLKNLEYDIFSVVSHFFIMYIIPHVLIHSFDAFSVTLQFS